MGLSVEQSAASGYSKIRPMLKCYGLENIAIKIQVNWHPFFKALQVSFTKPYLVINPLWVLLLDHNIQKEVDFSKPVTSVNEFPVMPCSWVSGRKFRMRITGFLCTAKELYTLGEF